MTNHQLVGAPTEEEIEQDRKLCGLADAVLRKRHYDEYQQILDHIRREYRAVKWKEREK